MFLKSFVLIALAIAIIIILFKQIGVEIEFEEIFQNIMDNSTNLSDLTSKLRSSNETKL